MVMLIHKFTTKTLKYLLIFRSWYPISLGFPTRFVILTFQNLKPSFTLKSSLHCVFSLVPPVFPSSSSRVWARDFPPLLSPPTHPVHQQSLHSTTKVLTFSVHSLSTSPVQAIFVLHLDFCKNLLFQVCPSLRRFP